MRMSNHGPNLHALVAHVGYLQGLLVPKALGRSRAASPELCQQLQVLSSEEGNL